MTTTKTLISRRNILGALAAAGLAPAAWAQTASGYPNHPIELVVPYGAGGGTDVLARAYAEATRKHLPQTITVLNKPGASGAIGWNEVINSKPDGYKLAILTVELTTIPHMGLAKFTHEDFVPIARLNADPAAITVKADAPWNTVEEFLAASRKASGEIRMGNSGNGSIWHLAAAALEEKANVKFNHVPFNGAAPAVLALLGGHIEAVAVSPAEVTVHVQGGKLKTLAVMADQRVKGFEKVPTLKERGIDLSIGTWRGLGAPKGTPPDIIALLKDVTAKAMNEPVLRETMEKQNMGISYADDVQFRATMARDNVYFKQLMTKLNIKA
ncbi:tripartite tricarboxylate transporter substrate binding protein [Ramlibacter sp.]|uniref:tripartite tricarboxylate transporter substrate binding protein n=1 Tax=Ramlibacter sp. TaxID=1917967 RepID=UPI001805AC37|nr:tripartite tricarboxylate transporter substrate binding protein [Ramlibacter sp.]MBA2674946.1 tripartite tricarboxylate transporter substrate binding protein [Ramlibacter sp.]